MPTLRMPYGQEVPLVQASAGLRRIAALACLLVHCLEKRRKQPGEQSRGSLLLLVDDIEAHLHPRWQRGILPSLLRVMDGAGLWAQMQLVVTTHSPLVMASLETVFDARRDAWLDLDLIDGRVELERRTFLRLGDVSNWVTSEAFDLESAYSREAEQVIKEAGRLAADGNPSPEKFREIHRRLHEVLSDIDPYWAGWLYIAEKKGWLAEADRTDSKA